MTCVHSMQWYTAERKPCDWSQRCTLRCKYCGVLLPLGPAKDDGEHAAAIEVEVRAAEIAQPIGRVVWGVAHRTTAHEYAGWCELQGDHLDPMQHVGITAITATSERQWWAGWLARQIKDHDEDAP